MRRYYSLTIVALIAASAVVTSLGATEVECPTNKVVKLPNPENCHSYYICENGKKIIAWCPEGLQFNSVLQQCDWPMISKKKCSKVDTQPDISDIPDVTDVPDVSDVPDVTDEDEHVIGECYGTCPDSDPEDRTVHIPVYKDCTKFCSCSNGNAIRQDCPPGLHFDKKLQVCNYPRDAHCPWK